MINDPNNFTNQFPNQSNQPNEESYGPIIGIVIVVAVLFFGGWFYFFGRQAAAPVINQNLPEGWEVATTSTEDLSSINKGPTVTPSNPETSDLPADLVDEASPVDEAGFLETELEGLDTELSL